MGRAAGGRRVLSVGVTAGLLGLVGASGGGCSSYEAPNLKVVDARVTERSEEGLVLTFTLDAENPNEEAVPLRAVTYRVSLDGRQVFEGTRSPEATLRRYGTQQIRLPAVVAASEPSFGASEAKYRIEGTLRYTTPGEIAEILFDTGVRKPSVGFSGEGTAGLTVTPGQPEAAKAEEKK